IKDMLQNSDSLDRVVGNIRSAAFAWYLGANLKTAVVNLTQNVLVGLPRLQMDIVGSAGYWSGAQKAIQAIVHKGKADALSTDEARLFNELVQEDIINDAFMEEVRGRVTGISGAAMWNKTLKYMGWFMSVGERFNRASLALAAFRAAREGKLKQAARVRFGIEDGQKASYEQAKAFAEEVVRDAHFVYGKANTPEFLRSTAAGRSLAAAYTFRTFSHNLLGLWRWALETQGREGRIFFGKSVAATLLLGGLTSIPFYATAMVLCQTASGDDDDWTEIIRKFVTKYLSDSDLARDMACYGLPAIAGVNIGGSLKLETPLTQGLSRGGTPKDVLTNSIGDLFGIPYDLFIVKPSKVMEAMGKGNTWRAVEEVSPTVMKNALSAWRLVTEGQTTVSGNAINNPGQKGARKLTHLEGFGKLLGFQPVSNTKSFDRYHANQHADDVRSDKINAVTVAMLKAKEANNL
ncbi:MAG: PLxRFG domain-containing protein, partial [Bilophila sp.]